MNRIEICGNIASGKTTLCQSLASKGFLPIFENFQQNPFYNKFYEDPQAYSFETELTFLLQHYHLIKIQKPNVRLVCDYSLLLDTAYADVNLLGNRHRIFCEIVAELQNEISIPAQVINLVCPEETLLQRIIARSRDAETSITVHYLRELSKAISMRVKGILTQTQVLTINSNIVNFTGGNEGIQEFESIVTVGAWGYP